MSSLIGIELKGWFQRDPELVVKSRESREKLKKEHPDELQEFDTIWGSSDIEDALIDRRYDFTIKILEYNLDSRSFIAKGRDYFGDSGIVGVIYPNRTEFDRIIKFHKIYAGKDTLHEHKSLDYFNDFFYDGIMNISNGAIFCKGKYKPYMGSENYRGIWELKF